MSTSAQIFSSLSIYDGFKIFFPTFIKSSSIPVDSFADVLWKIALSSLARAFPSLSSTFSFSYKSFLFAATPNTIKQNIKY